MPAARTFSRSAASRRRPSAPVSENPAVMTTTPDTPLAAQSSIGRFDAGRRHRDDREVDGAGDVRDPGIGLLAEDLAALAD